MAGLSRAVLPLIRLALREDQASRDITSTAVLPATARVRARIVARTAGILAGGEAAGWVFRAVDRRVRYRVRRRDGAAVRPGEVLATVNGAARSVFAAERTVLNLLGHLSGIATLTHAYVQRVRNTQAKIYDTRKTLPGLRALEKYAVRAGGGRSHRGSLAEAVLVKTNHLRALQRMGLSRPAAIREAVRRARRRVPGKWLEVEAATLADVRAALAARPDAILLDNMTVRAVRTAVRLRGRARTALEVSGGITLANVRAYARAGVDRISVGRLTHSAPALDVSLEVT
ncbi:MAG: carboxylating nicotinate-nucleotide diphosphorylase [Candidatus Omnitrophica bacterium]|nr:carboxylating nicotinate-nucleotide diphosphorylase [Candidatus Omnitrophota bacterium]